MIGGDRFTLDSNILVYAELEPETPKGLRSQQVIESVAPRGIITAQALLEFIAVIRRRRPASLPSAYAKVSAWSAVFEIAPTTAPVAMAALALTRDHRMQVWDSVIWEAARAAGATVLLTEDLQDGFAIGRLRAINPFALAAGALAALLPR